MAKNTIQSVEPNIADSIRVRSCSGNSDITSQSKYKSRLEQDRC